MMTGTVREDGTPVLWLDMRGTNGVDLRLPCVVDTGFTTALALPQDMVDEPAKPSPSNQFPDT